MKAERRLENLESSLKELKKMVRDLLDENEDLRLIVKKLYEHHARRQKQQ